MTRLARQPSLALEPKPKRQKAPKEAPTLRAPPGLRWLYVDPSKSCGLAWHVGSQLVAVGSLKRDDEDRYTLLTHPYPGEDEPWQDHRFVSDWKAWRTVVRQCPALSSEPDTFRLGALFFEKGHGASARSIDDQAKIRHFARALAYEAGCEYVMDINSSSWRKAAGSFLGRPFKGKRAELKRIAVEEANKHYGLDLRMKDDDIAEAVCGAIGTMVLGKLPEETP